ncbi:MAG: 50S ribosomal protein L25 [Calditrichaeota bacterium]|nr:MAG: 50S ribosomal protein L25 [Calditrichota bacterium]
MIEMSLNVELRKQIGKKFTHQLRREGKVPGVYYFHGEDTIPVAVDEKELKSVLHSEASIVDLVFNNGKKTKGVIREIQWDPVYGKPLHVDLMGVKLTETVTVEVPLHLVGDPIGVKQGGGILQQQLRMLEIEALPLDIPEHIDVDVSNLGIGDSFHVEDLKLEKVKILTEPSHSIAVVLPPTVVAEPTVEEEVEEEAEPEVVSQKKEEAEAEE